MNPDNDEIDRLSAARLAAELLGPHATPRNIAELAEYLLHGTTPDK